jgi:serine/threonine-protein kinase
MASQDDPTVASLPSNRAHVARARGKSVGRYLLLELCGEGGMGVVYKAYDPELGRTIALKLLQLEDAASRGRRERLLREAQALARLSHPNVIAVHDVGTYKGRVFIAMEFVEGTTLRAWLKAEQRTRREILDKFLAAGEGLAAAHRAGLVHRDFKPDNVMVGEDGRVRVLDFGLVREAHGETSTGDAADAGAQATESAADDLDSARDTPLSIPLTQIGAVMGTPRFMAPEQHRGEITEEPADQFSFCVSLYWALYGEYPFSAETPAERIEQMLAHRIADPPRDSTVPRWLREVLIRGLAPRPGSRHHSMNALLDALRADPALALRRRLRTALMLLAVVAVGTAIFAGAIAYKARRGAAEQARLAQQFGQEAERINAIARYAAMLPLHDLRRERTSIRARMDQVRDQMNTLGPLASGPGHHALGRGYVALDQFDKALVELDTAWAAGDRDPELAYELGLVHGQLFQQALAELPKTTDKKLDASRRDAIARAHRDPALAYLKLARTEGGANVEAPEYVEGMIALYEQRFDEGLQLAQKAGQRVSWLYEAHTLEGDIHMMAGQDRFRRGDVDGALAEYARAGDSYRATTAMASSSLQARIGDCRQLIETISIQVDRSQSPEALVKQAATACGGATAARPDDPEPLITLANAYRHLAKYQADQGNDPAPVDLDSIRLCEQALAIDPNALAAHNLIGEAAWAEGDFVQRKGGDPVPHFQMALERAERVLQINPGFAEGYSSLALFNNSAGEYMSGRGQDPRVQFQHAIDAAKKGIEISPDTFELWNNLGESYWAQGLWEMTHGLAPSDSFGHSVEAYGKLVVLNPGLDYGYTNLCNAYEPWAAFEVSQLRDPHVPLDHAIENCRKALALVSDWPGAWINLGFTYNHLATWQLLQKADPTSSIAEATTAFQHALALDSENVDALIAFARTGTIEGRWAATNGRDPEPAFARGEALARKAIEVTAGRNADALTVLAELLRRRAESRPSQRAEVARDLRDGLAMTTRALEQNPTSGLATAIQGALYLVAARSPVGDRSDNARRAVTALEQAIKLNANLEPEYGPLLADARKML